ncbi:8247_t:CDS:2 [Paraglomus brasilianum]|uniref:8247_t:CDS:1 n=1 Tax=Paraglomus brasilianum TaxID=144538 RepID=A0A9N9AAJ5_9GLOM|nr:8247_t:CDS:2 [Paraglomus brasilianum]
MSSLEKFCCAESKPPGSAPLWFIPDKQSRELLQQHRERITAKTEWETVRELLEKELNRFPCRVGSRELEDVTRNPLFQNLVSGHILSVSAIKKYTADFNEGIEKCKRKKDSESMKLVIIGVDCISLCVLTPGAVALALLRAMPCVSRRQNVGYGASRIQHSVVIFMIAMLTSSLNVRKLSYEDVLDKEQRRRQKLESTKSRAMISFILSSTARRRISTKIMPSVSDEEWDEERGGEEGEDAIEIEDGEDETVVDNGVELLFGEFSRFGATSPKHNRDWKKTAPLMQRRL